MLPFFLFRPRKRPQAEKVLPAARAGIALQSIVQVPVAGSAAAVPDTEQIPGVEEARVTARPEDAVSTSVVGAPTETAPTESKVIAWFRGLTVKFCVAGVAAEYPALPACDAVSVQVPRRRRCRIAWVAVPDQSQLIGSGSHHRYGVSPGSQSLCDCKRADCAGRIPIHHRGNRTCRS